MSIPERELKLALENAKAQIILLEYLLGNNMANELHSTSLDAIAMLDTEINKISLQAEHSHLHTVTENS